MKRLYFFTLVVVFSLCFLFSFNRSHVYAINNLAASSSLSSSSSLYRSSNITDGIKDTSNYSDSSPSLFLQWVQLDLGESYDVDNIKLWHYFGDARVYYDVIIQLSNSANFSTGVTTVFNNDQDDTAGLGAGSDSEYTETSSGKDISFTPVNARYARFYSNGSTINPANHYVEIEIYGSSTEPPPISSNLAEGISPSSSSSLYQGSNITDSIKDTSNYSDSSPSLFLQWVQLDLGASYDVSNIKLWHYFGDARVYYDVIIQLSNSANFSTGVTTVFNNDQDNTAGLGAGSNSEYTETSSGKNISFTPINARYARFYSNGSTSNPANHYVEIEIYGSSTEPPPISSNLAGGILPSSSSSLYQGSNITDSIKDTSNYSDSSPSLFLQWVQLDLGASYDVSNIKLWHYFGDARVYYDVIIQLSNSADFSTGVTTVFNNDQDNTAGLGAGSNSEYTETSSGKNISFTPVNARYARFYSNGSTSNPANHYVEIEIYGHFVLSNPLENSISALLIPTYDGSNIATHPSVQYFQESWNGYKYWMAYTPYPNSDSAIENPSVCASNDGINWLIPTGLLNPLAPKPEIGHNCDTEIFYNAASNELWLYYLESDDTIGGLVKVTKSSDGINWSDPSVVVTDLRAKYSTLSPTVDYITDKNIYYMWTVNTADDGCSYQSNIVERRESTDGITWSEPVEMVNFSPTNSQVWHIFVRFISSKNEYWAFYISYPNGSSCGDTMLYFSKSIDGTNWTSYPKPILDRGDVGMWDEFQIYRSCFVYNDETDNLQVWYSAQGLTWGIGYTQNTYSNFIKNLSH